MQLNKLVFPAPPCSYTTEKLFKDLVFIPRRKSTPAQSDCIPCLYLPHDQDSKVMLFFHGNAEDVGIAFDVLSELKNSLRVISIFPQLIIA